MLENLLISGGSSDKGGGIHNDGIVIME